MEREQKTLQMTKRKPAGKKRYVKPACTSETIYETLALACGKLAGQGGSCNSVPRRS
jgi:hypothetical protein